MSQFLLEQELQSALRLDTSVHMGRKIMKKSDCSSVESPGRSRSRSNSSVLNVSQLLNTVSASLEANGANNAIKQRSVSVPPSSKQNRSRNNSPSRQLNGSATWNAANKIAGGDRFIPNRGNTDLDMANFVITLSDTNRNENQHPNGPAQTDVENFEGDVSVTEEQRRKKTADLLMNKNGNNRILSFDNKAPAADEAHVNSLKVLYSSSKPKMPQAPNTRQVPSKPEKVLDAPDLLDDFYLHLLDWSVNNHLAVALVNGMFIWNAGDGSISELFTKDDGTDQIITSVSWIPEGNILGVGDSNGAIEIWDVTKTKRVRTMGGLPDRVPVLGWNEHILASGCRDGVVRLHDVRIANHLSATLSGHTQEVCGMAWSPDGGRLLATGSNDNLVHLWDPRNTLNPYATYNDHLAAVKAVSWCPWQPKTLATGGGTTDRTIKFWNTATGNLVQSIDTGSQVSSIVWNEEYKELVTGHGFSHNQLICWKYPTMAKVADLRGHTARVLLLLKSPDGSTIASAAADETIRLWKIWPVKDKKLADQKRSKEPVSLFSRHNIR